LGPSIANISSTDNSVSVNGAKALSLFMGITASIFASGTILNCLLCSSMSEIFALSASCDSTASQTFLSITFNRDNSFSPSSNPTPILGSKARNCFSTSSTLPSALSLVAEMASTLYATTSSLSVSRLSCLLKLKTMSSTASLAFSYSF